uniref:Enoyl reductase (ER) domain-containing protein n=1 Tax=Cuerna arida TaxID=1464854 RepID=A0A1B6EVQ0_9HEMI
MDEVAFHLSQRLESLQVVVYSAGQNGLRWAEQLVDKGYDWALSTWNSEQRQLLNNIISQKIDFTIQVGKHISDFTIKYTDPTFLYVRLTQLVGPDWDHRVVMAGCVGLLVGTGIGISVGLCLQSPPRPVSLMKAVTVTGFTGVDAVAYMEDIVTPTICSPDDVLIQVRGGTVDPIDIKICNGYARVLRKQLNKYNPNVRGELPLVLGRDMAGVVRDIGAAVTRLEVGDEVWCAVPPWFPGTLAEVVVVKQQYVSHKPRTLAFDGAASLPYSGTIAWDAVAVKAKLTVHNASSKRVLVHCASTGVGCLITQICHNMGAHVSVTCLNRAAPVMAALGADKVFTLESADIEKQLLREERYDIVFNTAGSVAHEFCMRFCKYEGFVITTISSQLASDTFGLCLGFMYTTWVRLAHSLFGYTSWGSFQMNYRVLDVLANLVDSGRLQPVVDKILQPHEIERAIQHIDSANAIGKTVLRFSGSSATTPLIKPDVIL